MGRGERFAEFKKGRRAKHFCNTRQGNFTKRDLSNMVFLEMLCYDRMGSGIFVLGSAVYISVYDANLSLNGERLRDGLLSSGRSCLTFLAPRLSTCQ